MSGFKLRTPFSALSCVLLFTTTLLGYSSICHALTWSEALQLAIENNSDLKAAQGSLNEAVFQKRATFGNYLPQISIAMGYTKSESRSDSSLGSPATILNSDSYNATLNFSENIFNGFGDQARLAQAQFNEHLLESALTLVKARVSQQLKNAFEGLIFSRSTLELSDEIIKRRKYNLSLVQLRFEGGRENKGSLLLSQAYLKQAQYDRLQADNGLTEARLLMASTLGVDPQKVSMPQGTVPVSTPSAPTDFATLATTTPDFFQAATREAHSRTGIDVARSALLPSLNLTGSVGKLDSFWFPKNDRWQIGIGLSIPLFSGGHDFYVLQAARANSYAATAVRHSANQALITKLQQTYDLFALSVEKESVDRSFLEAARTRADIARGKYNTGLLTFEEWDIIENDLINREKAALISGRDRVNAEASWEAALGKGAIP